jgi:hypothetical protein
MQNIVKTVDVLPNLPTELEIVLLRPSTAGSSRYQRQFRADFRVRKSNVLAWLRYLKAHNPDYRYINISMERVNALPEDADISSSLQVINEPATEPEDVEPDPEDETTFSIPAVSMVPNFEATETITEQILRDLTAQRPASQIPAPSVRMTPIDEAAGKERILSMAFPTLYPTGRGDFNTPRLREVSLKEYARHLMCFHDGRFGRHPRWRFFVFNLLMRRKAGMQARYYVSKGSNLANMTREELGDALQADDSLLSDIVRVGTPLVGTRPFWRNHSNSLQAHARFLSS